MGVAIALPNGIKFPGRENELTGDDVVGHKEITGAFLVKTSVANAPGKLSQTYVAVDSDARRRLIAHIQKNMPKGASKVKVNIVTAGTEGVENVVVSALPALPWYLELIKSITAAFLTAGAAALATGIASLIIGSPVTPWMFLAATVLLCLGTLSHFGFAKLA
ncbi:MAG: hypothetical protein LBD72_01925 [Puniceicoccales bacterium]|jgi:hypothetical protein|nr:hypothetical protein [Puniceicoccales bacterium]